MQTNPAPVDAYRAAVEGAYAAYQATCDAAFMAHRVGSHNVEAYDSAAHAAFAAYIAACDAAYASLDADDRAAVDAR